MRKSVDTAVVNELSFTDECKLSYYCPAD